MTKKNLGLNSSGATMAQIAGQGFLNGIMLISSVLDFSTVDFNVNNDLPYIMFLPGYTATAWYHDVLKPHKPLQTWLKEAEEFAIGDYAQALLKGHPSLLLHLEDIQWCDRDTLDWLCYLLQSHLDASAQVRLLVVGSLRIEELSPNHPLESLLAGLDRADQLTEIELGPLDESATFLLASRVVGRELDPALSLARGGA